MKVLENASSSTSLIRSCMDKSLKRKKGYQKIPFPGHRCGKHRSSFMISTTILRAACETSHMIQQGLYFPLTWINDKRNFLGNSLVLSLIHLYADDQSCKHREGRDQPLPSISGAKNTWKLLFCFHGEKSHLWCPGRRVLFLSMPEQCLPHQHSSDSRARIRKPSSYSCCF